MAAKKPEVAEADAVDGGLTRELAAENKIKTYVVASVGASIVPIPLFDIAAVFAIQLRMIQKISQLYGRPFSESAGRNVISALAGGVLGYGAGYAVAASAVKLIPGIGSMIGMATLPLVAGGATYAVGRTVVQHYEDGGSLFDFSAERLKAYYQEQFEKGKELAAQAKSNGAGQDSEVVSEAA